MVGVEGGSLADAGVERGGPAEGLLLGLGAVQIAAAGVAGGGEVEDGHRGGVGPRQPVGGFQAALARDLDGGLAGRAHRAGLRCAHRVGAVQAGRGPCGRHLVRDGHLAAGGRAIVPGRDDVLGLTCDSSQARAHAATPACGADAHFSPVVLMGASWAMLGKGRNGISSCEWPGTGKEGCLKIPETGIADPHCHDVPPCAKAARGFWVGRAPPVPPHRVRIKGSADEIGISGGSRHVRFAE